MGSIRTRRTSMSRRLWHSSSPSPERDKKQEAAACRLLFLRDHIRVGYFFFLAFFLAIDHPPPMRHAPNTVVRAPRRLDGIHAVAHIGSPPHLVLLLDRTTNFSGGPPPGSSSVKGWHPRRPNDIPRTMRVVAIAVLIAAAAAGLPAWAQPPSPVDIRGHWAEDRIQFLIRRNIVDLFPDQTFHPDEQITRGEFVKWLVLSSGLPLRPGRDVTFADVPPAHPLFPFIDAAAAFGLLPRTPNFLPSDPMRRGDAVVLTVKALGYAPEASGLQSWPLPYNDTALLPDLTRGAIAIVLVADPPLLQEPLALSFRPSSPMTRAEASSLLGLGLQAAEQGLRLRYTVPVTRGADLRIEKRGVLHTLPVWRVQIGAFVGEENADRLADSIRARGLPAFIDFQDGFYKVRVGSFGTVVEAMLAKEQLAADGFPTWVIQTAPDFDALPGPFRTAALIVDPRAGLRIRPASGDGQRMRRMRTSEIARRTGALAATNGGFFSTSGDPLGCLMVAGEIFSEPDPQRTCAGFNDDGVILFDRVHFEASVTTPAGRS